MENESRIFTPVQIGPVTLRNRVIRSAAFENMAYNNSPSQDLYDYHVAVARGGVGMTTNLFPALTLGCGAVGGSSSSNNIGPLDLINIRAVAWDAKQEAVSADAALIESLAQEILRRLQKESIQ